jgi:hypothetical protein
MSVTTDHSKFKPESTLPSRFAEPPAVETLTLVSSHPQPAG